MAGMVVLVWSAMSAIHQHRNIKVFEKATFQLRVDLFNVFNRSQVADPDTNPNNTTFGKVTAQTGSQNRFLQIQGRIQF